MPCIVHSSGIIQGWRDKVWAWDYIVMIPSLSWCPVQTHDIEYLIIYGLANIQHFQWEAPGKKYRDDPAGR